MNGRAIAGAEMNTFRLTNVIPERIIFASRGITVHDLDYGDDAFNSMCIPNFMQVCHTNGKN